ncbi:MAG: DUF2304 domain-containing protein [Candidatus Omnitrophica bacterium]|nr:DUF2304 domain-containing protein [Candidatus Omnitrophota bacterium]
MPSKTFAALMTGAILLYVLNLIRREKMSFKYAAAWLMASFLALFFSIKDDWLGAIASTLGFALPSNFIFFLLLIFVLLFSLLLTRYINEQNSRTEALAQAIAKLDLRLQALEQKSGKNTGKGSESGF